MRLKGKVYLMRGRNLSHGPLEPQQTAVPRQILSESRYTAADRRGGGHQGRGVGLLLARRQKINPASSVAYAQHAA